MIINKSDSNSVETTVKTLKNGGVVIIPTDTVYGFSGIVDSNTTGSQFNSDAKIRQIKGRSESKPLIQLIASPEDIFLYTNQKLPDSLLSKWPGALTIIVKTKESAPLSDSARLPTIAFRCPGDRWLRDVIAGCGAPVFSTSVNRSGQPVLDTEDQIISEFSREVDLIVKDGDKKGALPSTLVTIENDQIKVLRQGTVQI